MTHSCESGLLFSTLNSIAVLISCTQFSVPHTLLKEDIALFVQNDFFLIVNSNSFKQNAAQKNLKIGKVNKRTINLLPSVLYWYYLCSILGCPWKSSGTKNSVIFQSNK
jgi:hypothetical protein